MTFCDYIFHFYSYLLRASMHLSMLSFTIKKLNLTICIPITFILTFYNIKIYKTQNAAIKQRIRAIFNDTQLTLDKQV